MPSGPKANAAALEIGGRRAGVGRPTRRCGPRSSRRFEALIQRWNARSNLVARGDIPRLRERHTTDSLALLPWVAGRLADVGAGAGLPGIPLAIARPGMPVVLIERSTRKCAFLRHAAVELDLSNVDVEACDVRSYAAPDAIRHRHGSRRRAARAGLGPRSPPAQARWFDVASVRGPACVEPTYSMAARSSMKPPPAAAGSPSSDWYADVHVRIPKLIPTHDIDQRIKNLIRTLVQHRVTAARLAVQPWHPASAMQRQDPPEPASSDPRPRR